MISVQLYHSKNNYAIAMLSRPTLAVSRHTISPICDHGGPWGTMGDPLTAPKCPKMYPKPLDFLLSTSNVISMQSYHSKIDYAVTMLSQPTLAVSIHIISPICDHGGPPHSPKTVKTTPKTTRFSFVHVQHPPPTCIKVISSPKASNGQRFPCPALLFWVVAP